jgi:fructan beta-fructosidase
VIRSAVAALPASSRHAVAGLALGDRDVELDQRYGLRDNTWWLDAELEVGTSTVVGFKIGQGRDAAGRVVSETVIGYDAVAHQVYVDRSRSGSAKLRPGTERQTITLGGESLRGASGDHPGAGQHIRLQILLDKGSLEVFVNGGEKVLTTYVYPTDGAVGCSAFAMGGKAMLKNMRTWDLSKL